MSVAVCQIASGETSQENKHLYFKLRKVDLHQRKGKKLKKKQLNWFDGKQVADELKASGFKTTVNENELMFADRDWEIK